MFVTKWNFEEGEQSLFDDKEIVETAGYVPRQKTIENLLMCGQRLVESRMDEYDGATVEEALEKADITRSSDFDIVDAFNMLDKLSEQEKSGAGQNGTSSGVSMPLTEKGSDSLESEPTN